jgi:hypothetical protein
LIDGTDGAGNVVRADGGTEGSIQRQTLALGGNMTVSAPVVTQGLNGVPTLTVPGSQNLVPQPGSLSSFQITTVGGPSLSAVPLSSSPLSNIPPWLLIAGAILLLSRR